MAIILNIETATEHAFVSLQDGDALLGCISNAVQKEHASFLHPAIEQLLQQNNLKPTDLHAVSISNGPGSYTGLRVSMATAKGLCYALQIPLICISTLQLMASAAIAQYPSKDCLYCPMIDARRMEVFTAVYDANLLPILEPTSMLLDANAFETLMLGQKIYFFGNGSPKWEALKQHKNAIFVDNLQIPAAMQQLSNIHFKAKNFADLSFSTPYYLKAFYDGN